MYNKIETKPITKKRYFFRKGYVQLRMEQKVEAREKLIEALKIRSNTYFSSLLNNGILDITIYKYDLVTAIFAEYGITDVWDTMDATYERPHRP